MRARLAALTASDAPVEYARISPPEPSRIPPKYRVTATAQSVRPFARSTSRIGLPAVPEGSPSSLIRSDRRPSAPPQIAAYATWRDLGCRSRIASTNASASSSESTWQASPMNSDFFSTIASCAGSSGVLSRVNISVIARR